MDITEQLSERQLEIATAYLVWKFQHGTSPTIREVSNLCGISPATTHEHVQSLCDKKALRRLRLRRSATRKARGYAVTKEFVAEFGDAVMGEGLRRLHETWKRSLPRDRERFAVFVLSWQDGQGVSK